MRDTYPQQNSRSTDSPKTMLCMRRSLGGLSICMPYATRGIPPNEHSIGCEVQSSASPPSPSRPQGCNPLPLGPIAIAGNRLSGNLGFQVGWLHVSPCKAVRCPRLDTTQHAFGARATARRTRQPACSAGLLPGNASGDQSGAFTGLSRVESKLASFHYVIE